MPYITSNPRDDTYILSTRGSWSTGVPKDSISGCTRDSVCMASPSNSTKNDYYITSKSFLQVEQVHGHINASMATLNQNPLLHSLTQLLRMMKNYLKVLPMSTTTCLKVHDTRLTYSDGLVIMKTTLHSRCNISLIYYKRILHYSRISSLVSKTIFLGTCLDMILKAMKSTSVLKNEINSHLQITGSTITRPFE